MDKGLVGAISNCIAKFLILFLILIGNLEANITGIVFRDFPVQKDSNGDLQLNTYGVKDQNELGIEGVTVSAYDSNGNQVATTTTATDGSFTLNTSGGEYRVEISNYPNYLKESPNNDSVRFVSDGDSINFALHNPEDFILSTNPNVVTTIFVVGDKNDTNGPQFTISGATYDAQNIDDYNVSKSKTGSIWGLAYDPNSKLLYSASILRRHSDLGDGGLGGIYVTNYGNNTTQLFIDVSNDEDVGSINRTSDDIKGFNEPTHDSDAFGKIAKVGLGDIDISVDGKTLYVTNLYTRHILEYDIPTKRLKKAYSLPDNVCKATGATLRPFALKYHNGTIYSGAVCDKSDANNNLSAHVFKLNGSTFEEVLSGDLGYDREPTAKSKPSTYTNGISDANCPRGWLDWVDTQPQACSWKLKDLDGDGDKETNVSIVIYPQPLLTDIEFDENETMILAFSDRSSFQWGSRNYDTDNSSNKIYDNMLGGDILKATLNGNAYTMEQPKAIDENNTDEFFKGEEYLIKGWGHYETSEGGLAILKGSNEVVLSVMDPLDWNQGGLEWLDSNTGEQNRSTKMVYGHLNEGYFGKSAGVGDVEFLSTAAPVEIGNRVWLDSNANGVQDAGEDGISGVKVELYDSNGQLIASATTDNNGEYIFSNDTTQTSTSSHIYGISQLKPDQTYTIKIPNVDGSNKQSAIQEYVLTKENIGDGVNKNLNDSDGVLDGVDAKATVEASDIPYSGANNHSFDFGFIPPVSLGSFIWEDSNKDGVQDSGEKGISGLRVELLDGAGNPVKDGNQNPITTTTDSNGKYLFENLQPGDYKIRVKVPNNYIPTNNQNPNPNDNKEDDSNIADGNATDGYISGVITLDVADEPIENSNKTGDDQDDNQDSNGNMTLDLGFIKKIPLSIGSFVWEDENANGIQDTNEKPVDGARLSLLVKDSNGNFVPAKDLDGNDISDEITTSDGTYLFDNLPEGDYKVVVEPPSMYIKTPVQNANANDTVENDSNIASESNGKYYSGEITLRENSLPTESGSYKGDEQDDSDDKNGNMTIDFGFFYPAPSIDIEKSTNGEDADDEANAYEAQPNENITWKYVVTNNGNEKLTNIVVTDDKEGNITCPKDTLDVNESMTCTKDGVADKAKYENKGSVKAVSSISSKDVSDEDLSHYKINSIPGIDIEKSTNGEDADNEADAYQAQPDENITWEYVVRNTGNEKLINIVVTDDKEGNITCPKDTLDVNESMTCIKNGVANKAKYENKGTVRAVSEITSTNVSDEDLSHYKINAVPAIDIEKSTNGEDADRDSNAYQAKPDENITWEYVVKNVGNEKIINIYVVDDKEGNITCPKNELDLGESMTCTKTGIAKYTKYENKATVEGIGEITSTKVSDEDFSHYEVKYSLGDFVWEDSNKNGIQDTGESGIANVKVELLDSNGSLIASTTTDSNGKYQFDNLENGTYQVKFYPPVGFEVTKENQGSDDTKDSDANSNGLVSSAEIKDANNFTIDLGVYKKTYSLGDFVWEDSNKNGIQDTGESGIANVKVELLDSNGSLIASTTTDNNGKYQFDNLENGTYQVKFYPPSGFEVTKENQGSDDTKDSDANSNGLVSSAEIKDANNFTIDLGVYKKPVVNTSKQEAPAPKIPKIDIEKHTNKKDADTQDQAVPLLEGDKITWEYIVSNIGEDRLENIKVVDDKEGEIKCPKSSLEPGEKMICSKQGIAKDPKYQNTATVTAIGQTSQDKVEDKDSSWYTTKYIIGTHFWIDENKDGIYQEGIEKPVPNALVELFDANGNKIAQTRTNEKGEYRFLVDAGSYYVKFHLPEEFKEKGYVFDAPKGNDDNNLNANNADEMGFTMLATVGPDADEKHKVANLTLDGAINCGCDAPGIEQGSGDAFGRVSVILILMLTMLLGLRELEARRKI